MGFVGARLKRRTISLARREEFFGPFGHFPFGKRTKVDSRSTLDGQKMFHVMKGSSPPNKKVTAITSAFTFFIRSLVAINTFSCQRK